MFLALLSLGIMLADYVYHRWFQDQPTTPNPGLEIKVPTSTEGAVIPLYYGQCLIKAPVLAWWGSAHVYPGGSAPIPQLNAQWLYAINMFFIAGIGFSGFADVHLVNIYAGDLVLHLLKFDQSYGAYDGRGGTSTGGSSVNYAPWQSENGDVIGDTVAMGGWVQYYNGHPDQTMVDSGMTIATTDIARRMLLEGISGQNIPGYRGYSSVALYGEGSETLSQWVIGVEAQPPAFGFEFSSTPEGAGSGIIGYPDNTIDVNPIDVVYDLLTGTMGKLGLDPTRLDSSSMTRAATTLANEGFGMSRVWDDGQDAKAYLDEVMMLVDGCYYEDPQTGLFMVKLIRPDFDPTKLKEINPSNCSGLDNFAASGWTDVTNRVRVKYTDRLNFYRDGSEMDSNLGNAVGQTGEIREVQLEYMACTQAATAVSLVTRELQARSRPLLKCRVTVDQSFYRSTVGDPLMLTWPDANISRVVMRVASVSRGTLKDGSIIMDLLQDYFYVHRNLPPISIIESFGGPHTIGDEIP